MLLGPDGRPAPGHEPRRCMVHVRFVVMVTADNVQYLSRQFIDIDPALPLPQVGMSLPFEGFLVLATTPGGLQVSPVVFGPSGISMEEMSVVRAIQGHQPMSSHAARVAGEILRVPLDHLLGGPPKAPEPEVAGEPDPS